MTKQIGDITPGPWEWEPDVDEGSYRNLKNAQGEVVIASAGEWCADMWMNVLNPADAALIEAAPKLAAALKRVYSAYHNIDWYYWGPEGKVPYAVDRYEEALADLLELAEALP